jgi:hypothetical protein
MGFEVVKPILDRAKVSTRSTPCIVSRPTEISKSKPAMRPVRGQSGFDMPVVNCPFDKGVSYKDDTITVIKFD